VLGVPLLVAAAAVAAALTVPAAEAADPAACAPGGAPVTFSGSVAPADAGTYRVLPFQVAAGTTRVELTYDWSDPVPTTPLTQTVLDLGLWDERGQGAAAGFRGWSGSRLGRTSTGQPAVFVQQDVAARGYLPRPVAPGTWWADLGVGAVGPAGATWTVTARCSAPMVGPAFVPRPVDPTFVASSEPGWYHADFHVHGFHSNLGGPAGQALVDEARGRGLDVVPVTEYVTSQHWGELGPVQEANRDLVVWPGREIVTYFGHANALGETPSVLEYRHGFEGVRLRDVQRATRADGALFQVNHPTTFPGPVFSSFCRGCEFTLGGDIDWGAVDTMEVLTGPVLVDGSLLGVPGLPALVENPFMRPAIQLWERQLNAGHRITGVSGSDSKGVEAEGQRYGTSVTAIYARALSRPAIADALRAGHAYVRTRGVAASPEVEVTATAPDGRRAIVGDTLPADAATVSVTVRRGQGQTLQVSRDGAALGLLPVPITSDPFTYTFSAARQPSSGPLGTFYRVDTADLLSLTTIGGPVFLAGPAALARPSTSTAVAPLGADSATPAEVLPRTGDTRQLLLPGLALVAAATVVGATRRRSRVLPEPSRRGRRARGGR
jgi:hypothetical protein